VDEEISAKVIDFLDRNDPKKTNKPFFRLVQPGAHAHYDGVVRRSTSHMIGEKAARTGASRKPA